MALGWGAWCLSPHSVLPSRGPCSPDPGFSLLGREDAWSFAVCGTCGCWIIPG